MPGDVVWEMARMTGSEAGGNMERMWTWIEARKCR